MPQSWISSLLPFNPSTKRYIDSSDREYLIKSGIANVNDLQTESIKYSSAKAQCEILKRLMDENFFSDEELEIIRRARNHKTISHPKNCDIVTYKYATGFEALIGYLKLENKIERIDEIMKNILK